MNQEGGALPSQHFYDTMSEEKKYYNTKRVVRFSNSTAVYLPKQWSDFAPGDRVRMEVWRVDKPDDVIKAPYKTIFKVGHANAIYFNKDWAIIPGEMVTFCIAKRIDDDDPRVEVEE